MLDVENLNVRIRTPEGVLHAVQDLSFSVAAGETLAIVGESGCGKSVTALALMGLMPKTGQRTATRLQFDGIDLQTLSARQLQALRGNRVSMIFQEPMTALNPVLTIGQQLGDVLRAHRKVSRAQADARAIELLDRVGVPNPSGRLRQYPHELSGGLRQRVVIAMALMCEPELIIADEPTTALDVTIQAELLKLLSELQRDMGLGMILITHDVGIVSRIADRVLVMYAGQEIESGTAPQIFSDPAHPYTRGLLASVPSSDHPRMQPLPAIPGTVPLLIGERHACHFMDRCALAQPACARPVTLQQAADGRRLRCVQPRPEFAETPA